MGSVLDKLPEHLHRHYGIHVAQLTPFEPWAPEGVQRVDRHDGPPWVARVFPAERPIEQVEGDAELLRFLERHDFPAERCAHREAVSVLDGQGVLVTDCVPGTNARTDNSVRTLRRVGELLGRLHTLPADTGAMSRPAGGWHHLSVRGGGRQADVAALLPVMDERASRLPAGEREPYRSLRAELAGIDDCEDLPHALINIDLAGPNVIVSPVKGLTVVDWTGAGRGPRLLSMTALMYGSWDNRLVDAFVAGYRTHLSLTQEELDRLPGALIVHSLVLDCWMFAFKDKPPSKVLADLTNTRAAAEAVAARTRQVFTR